MKEYDKALETYEAGLKHDPDNAELKEGVARCIEAVNKVRNVSLHFHASLERFGPRGPRI